MATNSWDYLFNAVVEAPMETQRRLVPEGDYHARITDAKIDPAVYKTGEKKGVNYPRMSIIWLLQDEKLEAEWDRKDIKFTDSFPVDVDINGRLDTGPDKNIHHGQVREALGQNEGRWSPGMLKDTRPVLINIRHRRDPDDDERIYAGVSKVAAIS